MNRQEAICLVLEQKEGTGGSCCKCPILRASAMSPPV